MAVDTSTCSPYKSSGNISPWTTRNYATEVSLPTPINPQCHREASALNPAELYSVSINMSTPNPKPSTRRPKPSTTTLNPSNQQPKPSNQQLIPSNHQPKSPKPIPNPTPSPPSLPKPLPARPKRPKLTKMPSKLSSLLPWTKSPLIINAPVRKPSPKPIHSPTQNHPLTLLPRWPAPPPPS